MLLFRKLVDETQISKPQEYTDTFRQTLTSIFLSVRAILKETIQCETPCTYVLLETFVTGGSPKVIYQVCFKDKFQS